MQKDSKIYIAGHSGTAGSAILKRLKELDFTNIIIRDHKELDLLDQRKVAEFFTYEKPDYVFFAAAKLGHLGMRVPADILYENLMMQNNVFHNAYMYNVKKLIFFGSSWMYPQKAINPIKEEALLSAELDYVAEPYAISKIAGLKMAEAYNLQYDTNFICVALTNLYGETKDFDFKTAKVLPAMLRKIHLAKLLHESRYEELLLDLKISDLNEAKQYLKNQGIDKKSVELWGSGKPRREFIHSQDLADACIYIMQNINFKDLYIKNIKEIKNTHINIGTNKDLCIKELAELIKKIVAYKGELKFDITKPDSSMNRLLDCSKIHSLGWKHKIELEEGIKMMYNWYLEK
ncbi:GDP-L-fucose synthase family protein [Campylobacter hepaticus]|uniref:GDP-L-fucose synthase family protein n=1 Tax=Campylobacter hepaticus TaxID=1813019 RepID=UPI0029BEF0FA|nr:GDP-L-fucose synthase [Campylobacter hepaticus]MDX2331764.1 GDP-L-fucose synthase [Campylobacter hepaticus]MDX2372376.1 GDP-L-fucose synthase [Campylobacter hepaticus]MDX2397857.1 GDP-L-fucose synthase [Campylobacter hepaticus]MDX5509534.1 GDP-L-fucose synthase [Campylobacter hepaticus]